MFCFLRVVFASHDDGPISEVYVQTEFDLTSDSKQVTQVCWISGSVLLLLLFCSQQLLHYIKFYSLILHFTGNFQLY